MEHIYGFHSIFNALKAQKRQKIARLFVDRSKHSSPYSSNDRISMLETRAKEVGVPIERVERKYLDSVTKNGYSINVDFSF